VAAMTKYSIAEARHNLAAIVHELDDQEQIELTRRGEPVAVLLSMEAYRRLKEAPKRGFWDAVQEFRANNPVDDLDAELDIIDNIRDRSPGREVDL
jgi:prevent-host-death family protein